MAELAAAQALLGQLEAAFEARDHAKAKSILDALKLKLIELPSLPPRYAPSATAGEQLLLARSTHELGLLLAVGLGGDAGAVRGAWNLLVPYYSDARSAIPSRSALEPRLTALRLLHLLLDASPAAFHSELELLPDEILASKPVARVVELEADMAGGAYGRVLAAGEAPSDEHEAVLLARLADAVRAEVASCAAAAYPNALPLADARELLGLVDDAELIALAGSRGWSVDAARGTVSFGDAPANEADGGGVPAELVVSNCLMYAKEIERIV